jgi:transposase-like protein
MTKEQKRYENIEEQVKKLPIGTEEGVMEIIRGLYAGKPLLGKEGLLTQLIKDLTQVALRGEMDAHLIDRGLENAGNRRNGIGSKTVKAGLGSFELEVPRDRHSSFEPQIVKKRQTVLNEELDAKILAL